MLNIQFSGNSFRTCGSGITFGGKDPATVTRLNSGRGKPIPGLMNIRLSSRYITLSVSVYMD